MIVVLTSKYGIRTHTHSLPEGTGMMTKIHFWNEGLQRKGANRRGL